MDSHSITLVIVLIVLLILSAFFSATETAFSSLNRIRMKNLASEGSKRAKRAYKLSEDYDNLLSTILVGNNLVNIAGTAIATVLFVNMLGSGSGPTVSTIVMTVVVLIFGEVSPKSLAKEAPESFAMFAAPIIRIVMVIFKPINFFFAKLKSVLKKIVKVKGDRSVTDSELLTIVAEAEKEGGIDEEESKLIRNVIEFDDIEAADILTPRVDLVTVESGEGHEEVARLFRETGYSRLPVYQDSIDNILGVIHEKNFYSYVYGTDQSIDTIIKPVERIPPTAKISDLLRRLQKNKLHLAVVIDEYGGTEGIVTLEDVIEELIGEIWDEHDEVVKESFQKNPDGSYNVYYTTDLDDFIEFFNLRDDTDASSISGWATEHLGKIPDVGDSFEDMGLLIRVSAVENNRVMAIEVHGDPVPEEAYYKDGE